MIEKQIASGKTYYPMLFMYIQDANEVYIKSAKAP